jgi:hypothetical protein
MRKYFIAICILFTSFGSIAQDRISKKELADFNKNLAENPLLKDDDADFKNITSSNKWTDESAVILCQKTTFDYDKKGIGVGKRVGRNVLGLLFALPTLGSSLYLANARNETSIIVEETERRKILLQDKSAIEQYSVLYFRIDADKDAFNARVIKTDGSVQGISLSEAVKVENISNVPDVFRSYTDERFSSYHRPDYYKVVVPDLQEGDILEYEFVNYNVKNYLSNPNLKEFAPVYYLCNRSLPVEKQILEIILQDDKYHLGSKSIQGAPGFVHSMSGIGQVYRWEDAGREKMPDIRYVNKNLEMPSVKFQVVYAKNNNKEFMFVNDALDGKKELTDNEFSEKATLLWFSASNNNVPSDWKFDDETAVKALMKQLKKSGVADAQDDDFVRKAYYTIRSKTMYQGMSDYAFAKVFAGLLEKRKLPYEIVATNSNLQSSISNIAFVKEIQWAIKYKNKFYCNPMEHLNPGDIPQWLNGNKAVVFTKDEKVKPTPVIIPNSDTISNTMMYITKASLSADNMDLIVDESVQSSGLMKQTQLDDILALTPYMENDFKNYDGVSILDEMSEKERTAAEEIIAKQRKDWKEDKPKMMKELLQNRLSHDINGDVVFRLITDGRSFKKQDLTYNDRFTLSNMTALAGNDIVLSAPALIGDQSKIKPTERNRKTAADISFPRTIKWKITIAIPAGYSAQGLEQLNQSIINEAAGFTSTATVQGSELLLQVKKTYNTKYLDATKWPLMVQVLDAAFNWSQMKVILKKM